MQCFICGCFPSKRGMTFDHEGRRVKTKTNEESWIVHIKRCASLKHKHQETFRGQIYNQEPENK